ncbi:MAG: hypothetical protein R3F54_13670 [Alphaproteobacteria bacterium]
MTTLPLHPVAPLGGRHAATPKAGLALGLAALLLALLLGFSAVDIQRERAAKLEPATSIEAVAPPLDGRGKWGGYL